MSGEGSWDSGEWEDSSTEVAVCVVWIRIVQ